MFFRFATTGLPGEDWSSWRGTDRERDGEQIPFCGGAYLVEAGFYRSIGGHDERFLGWGGEDDELQRRLAQVNIDFTAPDQGTLYDLEEMSLEEKLDFLRENKSWKNQAKWEAADEHRATWRHNGLVDLDYDVIQTIDLAESDHASIIKVNVGLNGQHWSNDKADIDYLHED